MLQLSELPLILEEIPAENADWMTISAGNSTTRLLKFLMFIAGVLMAPKTLSCFYVAISLGDLHTVVSHMAYIDFNKGIANTGSIQINHELGDE